MHKLLALAEIEIGGNKPWDIQVHDERFFNRIFSQGILGIGEAYMDGWWDMKELDQFMNRVLMAWFANFDRNWDKLKYRYNERFYRMWKYYLLSMAGTFRSRQQSQLWQIVLSKRGVHDRYRSMR